MHQCRFSYTVAATAGQQQRRALLNHHTLAHYDIPNKAIIHYAQCDSTVADTDVPGARAAAAPAAADGSTPKDDGSKGAGSGCCIVQ
jgi:hypothetical protein